MAKRITEPVKYTEVGVSLRHILEADGSRLPTWVDEQCTKEGIDRLLTDKCRCGVCKHHIQIYKRRINASMMRAIRTFAMFQQRNGNTFVLARDIFKGKANDFYADFSKMCHHKFLDRQGEPGPDKNRRKALYRITPLGLDFLADRVKARLFYYDYLDNPLAWSDALTVASDYEDKSEFRYDVDISNKDPGDEAQAA